MLDFYFEHIKILKNWLQIRKQRPNNGLQLIFIKIEANWKYEIPYVWNVHCLQTLGRFRVHQMDRHQTFFFLSFYMERKDNPPGTFWFSNFGQMRTTLRSNLVFFFKFARKNEYKETNHVKSAFYLKRKTLIISQKHFHWLLNSVGYFNFGISHFCLKFNWIDRLFVPYVSI